MKEGSIALLALGLAAATAGLVFWGHSRAKDPPGSPLSPAGGVAGQFPGLRLNDVLLVDTTAAKLPGPFNVSEQATMIVDIASACAACLASRSSRAPFRSRRSFV